MTQEFSQAARQPAGNCNVFVPGMSQYRDSQDILSDDHDVDMDVGTEDFQEADQKSAAISQRCKFFELSPR